MDVKTEYSMKVQILFFQILKAMNGGKATMGLGERSDGTKGRGPMTAEAKERQ